jgi:hypothetical protein
MCRHTRVVYTAHVSAHRAYSWGKRPCLSLTHTHHTHTHTHTYIHTYIYIYISSGSGEVGVAVLQRQVAELRAALTEAEEGKQRALEVLTLLALLD